MNLSPEVTHKEDTRSEPTEEQLRGAAAFDRMFGPNALEFQRRQENAATTRTVQIVHPFNENHRIDLELTGAEAYSAKFSSVGESASNNERDVATKINNHIATAEERIRENNPSLPSQDVRVVAAAYVRENPVDVLGNSEMDTYQSMLTAEREEQVDYYLDLIEPDEWNRQRGFISMPREPGQRDLVVAQTINEAQENGALQIATDQQTVVAVETNEVVEKPTDKEIKSALAARSALETERQNILVEAQTPHEVGLDGALKSYVNGRADAYNNIRNALAESSTVELPNVIEPEEIAVVPPTIEIDDRQQILQLAL